MSDVSAVPFKHRLTNAAIRGVLGAVMLLPYRWRVPVMGWVTSRLVAPLLGWRKRIRANLAHVCPEMAPAEVARLTRAVPDNWGRTLIEIASGPEFAARVAQTPIGGPGAEAFEAARSAGRRVILVTGHFGNYDAPRAALHARGHPIGALYREAGIKPFNDWYAGRIAMIASPVFPATRKGIVRFVRHLRDEGIVGILIDIHASRGAHVTFFGKTAPTSTSVAEWALKYDAEVFPLYSRRRDDGLSFDIVVDAPIPHGDPVAMTQALNDSLEAHVRQNMEQWFWVHRRWKPERRGETPPT